MREALTEARKGLGMTSPNPAVGAVIVRRGEIVARGYHRRAGGPHAEVEALNALPNPKAAKGASLYVTLEPCSTHGRTPPCTDAVKKAGFTRVIYGATDPNPAHAGRALEILSSHGIRVTPGILEEDCRNLNHRWNHWIATGLPWVIAKAGMSLDGCIGSHPGKRWITGEESRADVMKLRATCDAILVGGGTVRADNPRLTIRGVAGVRQPLRVVWTKSGDIPAKCHLLSDAHRERTRIFEGGTLRSVLRKLGSEGIQSVLIEGGSRVHGEAFDRGLVNEACFYIAPVLLGGGPAAVGGLGAATPEQGWKLENPEYLKIGNDLRISGRVIPAGEKARKP